MRPEHVIRTPTNGSAELGHVAPSVSRDQYTALPLEGVLDLDTVIYLTYTFWYNFVTVLRQFLETGTSDRCFIGIVKLLRFSSFSLHPLSFFLYSPFNKGKWMIIAFEIFHPNSFICRAEIFFLPIQTLLTKTEIFIYPNFFWSYPEIFILFNFF